MRTVVAGIGAAALLVVAIVMVTVGMPAETPVQQGLLAWSQAPIIVAIALISLHLATERELTRSRRFQIAWLVGLAAICAGALWLIASPSHLGGILMWTGVAIWIGTFVVDFIRRG